MGENNPLKYSLAIMRKQKYMTGDRYWYKINIKKCVVDGILGEVYSSKTTTALRVREREREIKKRM